VHLGPASDRSNDLAKSAFRLLHRRYANSIWARENSFWYRGGGSPTSLAALRGIYSVHCSDRCALRFSRRGGVHGDAGSSFCRWKKLAAVASRK
jgi:hypothetical protein